MDIPAMAAISTTDILKSEWPADGLESVSNCPICGSARRQLAYEGLTDRVFCCAPGRWDLYCCNDCGSAYLDPRPTPSTISLAYSNYYTHAQTDNSDARPISWRRRRRIAQRNHFLNKHYNYNLKPSVPALFLSVNRQRRFDRYTGYLRYPGPGARLLDIGCGNGSFLLRMRSLGWEVFGVEPDPKSAEQARAAGLNVQVGLLPQASLPEDHFDAAILSHVIEHLHDPVETLQRCCKLLKPNGKLVIYTPNYEARGRALFGPCWRGLETPRHLVLFTETSLWQTLERCGFSVSRTSHPTLNARHMFRMSYLLRDEYQNSSSAAQLPWHVRLRCGWAAFKADRGTLADPRRGEELVLLGTKVAQP
jgi:2-polyprenyl-3-methyl-5-hydroxy-6-metoxy-1,4-benzoquinol methylase